MRTLSHLTLATVAIGVALASPASDVRAQSPWPNARCYELTRGPWHVEGDTTRSRIGPPPPVPDLLILDDALVDRFVYLEPRAPDDTALHVVRGRSRDSSWSDPGDPSFVWWRQPRPDSLVVWFGTGFGGIDFGFTVVDDRLRGSVGTHSDRSGAPFWEASVTGSRTRCPPAPAPIGRLRLTVSDSDPQSTRLGRERLALVTEREFDCGGQWINYEAIEGPDRVAVRVRGIVEPHGGCKPGRGPARTDLDVLAQSRRVLLLIKHEGDTNRFVLETTDSSVALITQRATTVIADQRVRLRPRVKRRDE